MKYGKGGTAEERKEICLGMMWHQSFQLVALLISLFAISFLWKAGERKMEIREKCLPPPSLSLLAIGGYDK